MIILSKIFSRERPLIHFWMWNESDRLGFQRFLHHQVKHNLFIREREKTSVWYDLNEIDEINTTIAKKINADTTFLPKLIHHLEQYWSKILSYVSGERELDSPKQAREYYAALVEWWSAMTIVINDPDLEKFSKKDRETVLVIRKKYEKYSTDTEKPLQQLWDKLNVGYEQLFLVAKPEEVEKLSPGKIKELQERMREGFGLFNGKLYHLDELKKQLQVHSVVLNETEKIDSTAIEVKGRVACKGFARGKVRIILSARNLSTFKEGEILVTEMTEPNFVPIMHKAAAIVTDEGGITSHAAIISRELGIPCIVGTQFATKVFKDGDLVEVDAEKGVVRKL